MFGQMRSRSGGGRRGPKTPAEIRFDRKFLRGLLFFLALDILLLVYLSIKGEDEICGRWSAPYDSTCETSWGSSYRCQQRDCMYKVPNPDARDWFLKRRYKEKK